MFGASTVLMPRWRRSSVTPTTRRWHSYPTRAARMTNACGFYSTTLWSIPP